MSDTIVIVPYDPQWPQRFEQISRQLRSALGEQALRIDHIGSTAVPNLAAKPVIDIQISVATLEPVDAYRAAVESAGFVWRADNDDRTKRYFRELPGQRRIHIHVRRAGSWAEQLALLFRDYLRAHPDEAAQYATLKQRLAAEYSENRAGYTAAKGPFIWQIMQQAAAWSQRTGWEPGPADC
jgi:GrpB-like predicted nucleotidyltransferase (UPF0157 family)